MHPLVQENFYLRQRLAELERENQRIQLLLAAKTLIIDKIEFNFDKINIDNLAGSLQIGVAHQADELNPSSVQLPSLHNRPGVQI